MAQLLVDKGADLNARGFNNRTLLFLSWNPDPELLEFYLSKGIDVNTKDASGETALVEAENRRGSILEDMHFAEGDPNSLGHSRENLASVKEQVKNYKERVKNIEKLIEILLKHGAQK